MKHLELNPCVAEGFGDAADNSERLFFRDSLICGKEVVEKNTVNVRHREIINIAVNSGIERRYDVLVFQLGGSLYFLEKAVNKLLIRG